jgi:DNA polymerase elongation subunit (family B)
MNKVVFDIETLGFPLESFDEKQQEYLTKFAKTDEERTEAIQKLNLSPLTARIIAIGMINPDSNQGKVLYDAPQEEPWSSEDGMIQFVACDERGMIEEFWKTIMHYGQFITFNGRSFDCPFIMLRSAVLGIKATKNLMPYRYASNEHCDLMEQLTFYGAVRKFNLDFYCKTFNIKSPKDSGITGLDLGALHQERRFREIAEYCIGDVKATAELYHRWQTHLAFEK